MKLENLKVTGALVPVAKTIQAKETLAQRYERGTKLVFLFDCSSSMGERISKGFTDRFVFAGGFLDRVKTEARHAFTAVTADPLGAMMNPLEMALAGLLEYDDTGTMGFPEDEKLKEAVCRHDVLISHFMSGDPKLKVNWQLDSTNVQLSTRMTIVKQLARIEVDRRLAKYPDALLAVIPFDSYARTVFNEGTPEQLHGVIEGLSAFGGTSFLRALNAAMDACREKPSPVGIHHFVMVGDGEDHFPDFPKWIPTLKTSGVVFDYIHIGDGAPNCYFQEVCKATGGECVVVNCESDLRKKFEHASNRKCLPAGVGV
jgi:hypothetical protein